MNKTNYENNNRPCAHCKWFTMHFVTKEPESQRCKKYNKHVKMGDHLDCKGFKERDSR